MRASSLLVTAQFGLALLLILLVEPRGHFALSVAAFACVVLGTFVGTAALAANRLGNFNIRPDLKPDAQLITTGIYRWIRHPMYTAFALVMLAAVIVDPSVVLTVLWLALCAVLRAKALREEGLLRERFAEYAEYMARSKRFVPGVY